MGKRKERRLAAKLAANRRVKLDIFAEPPSSGDVKNNSAHDEIGGDMDQDLRASSSPSSSGQRQENPLQLLGQYSDESDDEVDDETSKHPKLHVEENSLEVLDDVEYTKKLRDIENEISREQTVQMDMVENIDGNDDKETDSTYVVNDVKDIDSAHVANNVKETDSNVANDIKETDSNHEAAEYSKIDQVTQVDAEITEIRTNGAVMSGWKLVTHEESNQYYYWNTVTGETSWDVPTCLAGQTASMVEGDASNQDVYASAIEANQTLAHYGNSSVSELYANPSALANFSSLEASTVQMAEGHVLNDEMKAKHFERRDECYGAAGVHSFQLAKWCESLLHRLEALDRSGIRLEDYEIIKKEIEIRLSDFKALAPYGSSLLPFWWHTEVQLKQLESSISRGEGSIVVPDKHDIKLEATQNPPLIGHTCMQNIDLEADVMKNDKEIPTTVISSHPSPSPEASVPHIEASSHIHESKDTNTEELLVTKVEPHVEEDVDMDVEMEVDEEPVNMPTGTDFPSTSEKLPECPPLPPDEEWIPPPPPDSDEPVPPPPPEEPPLPDSFAYPSLPEQYNINYSALPYDYYSSTTEVAGGNYYTQPVLTTALPEVPVNVNSVEPVPYYSVASGSVSAGPVLSSLGSSGYYVESGPFSYFNTVPTSAGFTTNNESNISLLPKVNSELKASATSTESKTSTLQAAFVPSSIQSGESGLGNVKAVDAVTVDSNKNQTKVRKKKQKTVVVAPSLRSSKIHGLVDKWKAAKEELHSEEDEEPESAYEIIEKKRQKEIEQWRARQIASGEAHDNANFTPLGGDWRDRVKRKRAKANAEAAQSPKEVVDREKKQPDIVELSKDLPSGWQAYWDESSKGVYYGNTFTSETTWIRPTK